MRLTVTELDILDAIDKGQVYGYRILAYKKELTPGTMYPILRGMAEKGWLAFKEETSNLGPARRNYRLTEQGRAELEGGRKWAQTISE
jgi:PadR family transcriptional regulator PadR